MFKPVMFRMLRGKHIFILLALPYISYADLEDEQISSRNKSNSLIIKKVHPSKKLF